MTHYIDIFVCAALDELERFYYTSVVARFCPPDLIEVYEDTQAALNLLESGMCHCVLYCSITDSKVFFERTQKQYLDALREATKLVLGQANPQLIAFIERRLAQRLERPIEETRVLDAQQTYENFWKQLDCRFDKVREVCEG